jgi:hypothetical protein
MRCRHVAGVLLVVMSGLLLAQSGTTADKKAPVPQAEKSATHAMVGLTKRMDAKTVFAAKEGGTWEVSNPDKLRGHEGRAVEITGTFNEQTQIVHIETVSDMACGPKFCERQCKGKCGNGSACDCPKR